jgi:hypothetical protein
MCSGAQSLEDVATRWRRRASGRSLLRTLLASWHRHGAGEERATIYYQLSDPITMILVLALRNVTGARLIVHVLDNFIETAKYRRFLGIPRTLAIFTMRRADQLLTISPSMRNRFLTAYRLPSRTAFRWRPVEAREQNQTGNGRLIFGGAVNDRTNLSALREVASSLADATEGMELDVFIRGGNSTLESLPHVRTLSPIEEDEFIELASHYEGVVVPFNSDAGSFSFYRDSCPSKASSLFATQIPILTIGPSGFWFLDFLRAQPFTADSIDGLRDCRAVPSTAYVRANQFLGEMC